MSIRLIRVTGALRAWVLIAAAVCLMAIRRCITLFRLISGDLSQPPGLAAEIVALAISMLLVAGIALITPLFRSIKDSEKELKRHRNRLEDMVQECTAELQKSNELLREETAERRQAEEEKENIFHKLNVCVKELNALYALSEFVEKPDISMEEILGNVPYLLPPAWQYTDAACARVIFRARIFETENFKKTRWKQSADVKVNGEKLGTVEVYYLEEKPESDEGPFLKEERNLLQAIAKRLGKIVERFQTEDELRSAHRELEDRAAKLEAANSELSQYARLMSHDVRAPLRAIHNYAEFLLEDLEAGLEGEQKEYLNGLKSAVREAEDLVEDLLELSRIDRRTGPLEPVVVGAFLKDLITSLDLPAEVEVVMANYWPCIEIEAVLLRQIFQNLISNAVKFNISQGKRVKLGWQPLEDGAFEFFVQDNGIGIDERYHGQIFRVFERLHSRKEYEGTGIGLAIVKRAARKLHGTVRVESKTGEGSTFFITLPGVQEEKQ